MEYIIYGTDESGRRAYDGLGSMRVGCFADEKRAGTEVNGKKVLSLREMAERYRMGKSILAVASPQYFLEIKEFLLREGIEHCFVYSEEMRRRYERHAPRYNVYGKSLQMAWTDILMRYRAEEYHHIAVCANEADIPYLMAEIAFQCDGWTVDYIISDTYTGLSWMGVPIVKAEEVFDKIDGLVIASYIHDTDIRGRIPINPGFVVMDLIDLSKFVSAYHHPELAKFKDMHRGESCFIIGNGPSLKMEDLDMLADKNITCFGVNKIYLAFEKTKWRPDYLCISDPNIIALHDADLDKTDYKEIFYNDTPYHDGRAKRAKGVNFFHMLSMGDPMLRDCPRYSIKFTDDITVCTYCGRNSIYDSCLQIASYMGFSKIYLLGTDCTFSGDLHDAHNHFIKNYSEGSPGCFNEDSTLIYDMLVRDYEVAERYSRTHNFRIYNATRGGALDVFERVDFDAMMKEWGT